MPKAAACAATRPTCSAIVAPFHGGSDRRRRSSVDCATVSRRSAVCTSSTMAAPAPASICSHAVARQRSATVSTARRRRRRACRPCTATKSTATRPPTQEGRQQEVERRRQERSRQRRGVGLAGDERPGGPARRGRELEDEARADEEGRQRQRGWPRGRARAMRRVPAASRESGRRAAGATPASDGQRERLQRLTPARACGRQIGGADARAQQALTGRRHDVERRRDPRRRSARTAAPATPAPGLVSRW